MNFCNLAIVRTVLSPEFESAVVGGIAKRRESLGNTTKHGAGGADTPSAAARMCPLPGCSRLEGQIVPLAFRAIPDRFDVLSSFEGIVVRDIV